ncbi:MAG TPA: efflux RND transporter periplasmic adaptor subunit [Vicinamibacteria bacterium]|jgi:HlyD family secretion protein|nr:efflux RND transporter periplasmic adaptor subunit [Vicinamibacteria bacterium]
MIDPALRFRWRWVAGIAVLLAAGVAFDLARAQRVSVRLGRASRSRLVVPVLCAGTLQPPPGGDLMARQAGLVGAIWVREGERVFKGAPLLRLDAPELAGKAAAAREELFALREAKAVAEAQLDGEKREASYRRSVWEADRRLLEQQAISRAAYEADELAARQAEAQLRVTEARMGSIAGGGPGAVSRLDLVAARARDLAAQLDGLTVRAPAAGVVYGLPRRVGEPVSPGQVVASVTEPAHPYVRLRVDPPDLPLVAEGQRFVVTFDGLPNREWDGRIEAVGRGLREASGREVAEVLGALTGGGQDLPFNASVNVKIVVGEKPSALLVPRAALHQEGQGRFVYVEHAGRAERREISVGLVGLTDVEVTAGLTEGESVILSGDGPLFGGLRVTPRS